ncbi:MAG TPA: 6-pyruvoyl-tetrahydropterin synthase-related protein [Pyrinomonadaceae bacterium]
MSSRVLQSHEAKTWSIAASPAAKRTAFVVAISVLAVVPVLIFGVPSNRDLSNHFRFALPFYDAIAGGNFYPGWLAESNGGYGDPSFRFYPPALYYLLSLFRFATGEWYFATLLTFSLISVAAGLGIYFWARSVLTSSQAMWVGLIYALAPYHLNQLYQGTMLAEWAGSAVLPFVFGFLERVCANGKRRDIAGFAFCYALLVLTHLPLTVIGSMALVVYAVVRIESRRRLQTLGKLVAAAALGLCASSIYWVTMVSEMRWIGINSIDRDASVDYRLNFILSTLSPDNLNVWWMNILLLLTLLLAAPIPFLLRRGVWRDRRELRPVATVTAFAVFMTLPLSRPIWDLVAPLQQTQFPWRWLAIVSLGITILTTAALTQIKDCGRVKRLVVLGAMCISIAFSLSHIVREAEFLSPRRFEVTLTEVRGTPSVNYWFPIWAASNPKPMNAAIDAAGRAVSVASWTPEFRKFSVAAGDATEARVKTFYYPHWTAQSGEQVLQTRPDKDGALLISVPHDAVSVDLVFKEPRRSRVSAAASLAGFIFIGALAMPLPWRRKR